MGAVPAIHSEAEEHAWFTQQYNVRGGDCCGLGDAYILDENEWKNLGQGHYSVKIEGQWYPVESWQRRDLTPDPYRYQPLRGTPAPAKKAVVWFKRDNRGEMHIFCFSPWEDLY